MQGDSAKAGVNCSDGGNGRAPRLCEEEGEPNRRSCGAGVAVALELVERVGASSKLMPSTSPHRSAEIAVCVVAIALAAIFRDEARLPAARVRRVHRVPAARLSPVGPDKHCDKGTTTHKQSE
jgi:hypothetical protein